MTPNVACLSSSAAEALLLALLYKEASSQPLHARLERCTALQQAIGVPLAVYSQVLSNVQQKSKEALCQLAEQLQQLHASANTSHTPEGSAAQPHGHTAPKHRSRPATAFDAANFCSELGFLAWARLCWEQQQQLLLQLQQLPAFYAELQLQVQNAVLSSPEPQAACVSCICARSAEAGHHNPYCVTWLKNNSPATPSCGSRNSNSGQHSKATGGLLLLQSPTWPQHAAAPYAGGVTHRSTTLGPTAQHLSGGTQTQHTSVVEGSDCPSWGQQLDPYHITYHDSVLRLQVRSSTATGATLDWFRQTVASTGQATAQSSASGSISKLSSISDPVIGQVSIRLSTLYLALLQASGQSQDCVPWMQQPQQLVLPLYGPLESHSSRSLQQEEQPGSSDGMARSASKRGFGLRSKRYRTGVTSMPGQQLPDFLADAVQHEQQVAAGAAGAAAAVVAQRKAPLAVPHTASAVLQGLQHLVLYDPVSGASYGVQGRELVGKVHLLLTYDVAEQLQPAASTAQLTSGPVQALLDAAEAHGQQVPLPQPLCPSSCSLAKQQAHEAASPAPGTDGPGHAALAAALELVVAVWKLWKIGGLSDLAASYEAQFKAAMLLPAEQAVSNTNSGHSGHRPVSHFAAASAAAAAAAAGGVNSPMIAAARGQGGASLPGLTPEGSTAEWTLGTSNSYAGSVAHSEAYSDRFSYLQAEYELSHGGGGLMYNHSWQSSGGLMSDHSWQGSSTAGSPHRPRGASWLVTSSSRSSGSSGDGSAFKIKDWRHPSSQVASAEDLDGNPSSTPLSNELQTQPQQSSRLQRVTHSTAQQQQQQQLQPAERHAPGQPDASMALNKGPTSACREAARVVMQLLSLQRLALAATAGRAVAEQPALPGVFYLHLLHDAAVLSGARPAAVRLGLLGNLLQSWVPDQNHLTAVVDLISPLMIADRQLLLTRAESEVLRHQSGSLVDAVQQLISCHYDLYPNQTQAAACLSLLVALMASLLGCQEQHQLAEAVSPLLASAAKRRFMQAIEPDTAAPAAAAVDDLLATLLGAPGTTDALADSSSITPPAAAGQGPSEAAMVVSAADGPLSSHAANNQLVEQARQDAGLFDMFKFRQTRAGGLAASDSANRPSSGPDAGNQLAPSTPGLFSSLMESLQQRHVSGGAGSADGSGPGTAWAQQLHSSKHMAFWGHAGGQQLPLQRGLAGPIAEGLLRSDSDEALEAAVRALEMGETAGAAGSATGVPQAGSSTAASGFMGRGKQPGVLESGQFSRGATGLEVPAVRRQGSTSAADSKRPVAASDEVATNSAAEDAPVIADLVLHTKLEYDLGDSSKNSSGGSIGSPLTAAWLKRRTTASAVLSDAGIPAVAQDSSTHSINSGPVHGGSRGRHTRIGSVGTIDGLFSRLGRVTRDETSAQSTPSALADGTSNTLLAQQHSAPLTASALSCAASTAPAYSAGLGYTEPGKTVLGRFIRHGRSGSAGSLDLQNSHNAALKEQEQHAAFANTSTGNNIEYSAVKGASSAAAVVAVDGGGVSAVGEQGAELNRDIINLTVAVCIVMEELQRDTKLQEELPPLLQLPLIGLHVRYSLVNSHLKSLLACSYEVTYDNSLQQLEAAVRQLHSQLLQQGWAVEAAADGQGTGIPGQLPQRDAEGALPPVVLCELDSLMAPVWKSWLRKSGQHLLSVVDSLIAAQSDANQGSGSSSRGRHGSWAPVAPEQGAYYSSSVIDLFQLLQGLTDQVLEQAVKPVGSLTYKAANITALAEILEAAVSRFVVHLHSAAVGLLRVGQVVMAPGTVVQSGKITRHRRGESMSNSPVSRAGSAVPGQRRHTRVPSGVPASVTSLLGPASAGSTGTSVSSSGSASSKAGFLNTSLFASGGSNLFSAGSGTVAGLRDGLDGSSSSMAARGLSSVAIAAASSVQQQQPVSVELCVVLNSLQEVQLQQQQLAQRIWAELDLHAAEAASQQQAQGTRADVDLGLSSAIGGPSASGLKATVGSVMQLDPEPAKHSADVAPAASKTAAVVAANAHGAHWDDSDNDSESDISVMSFTDDEDELQAQKQQQQPDYSHQIHCSSRKLIQQLPASQSTGLGDNNRATRELSDSTQTAQAQQAVSRLPGQQQPAAVQRLNQQAAQQVMTAKQNTAELSTRITSLMYELLQLITGQLQPRRLALLAGLFAVWAQAEGSGADMLSDPGVQLVLAPLHAELVSLNEMCCWEVCQKVVMAQWEALLAAVSQAALCQAWTTAIAGVGSVPQPLQEQHVALLQRLLLVLQSDFSDVIIASISGPRPSSTAGGSRSTSKAGVGDPAAAAVADIAAAAVHTRALLQLLQQPTAVVIQKYLDSSSTSQQMQRASSDGEPLTRRHSVCSISKKAFGQQPTQLDVLRCLRQRTQDPEAQVFVQLQLRKAGTDVMRLLFGLPEMVKVYAGCTTAASVAGASGSSGGGNAPSGILSGIMSSSSSSAVVCSTATGCLYLSQNHIAFTDIISDVHSSEDDETFSKRFKKHLSQQKVHNSGASSNRSAGKQAEAGVTGGSDVNPAAAGVTGSSTSSLSSKSWWRGVMPSAASGTTISSAAASAIAGSTTADTTFLIALNSVSRLDKVYFKGQDALSVTLLDRSSRVFYGFESVGVRDRLFDEVRLAAMGSNSALDRNLRLLEPTEAALELGLPAGEKLIRTYQCLKYGTVRNKPGNLYVCSNLLAFDYDDSEPIKAVAGPGAAGSTASAASAASAGPTGGLSFSKAAAGLTGGSYHPRTQDDGGPEQVNNTDTLLAVGSRVLIRYQDISRLRQEKAQWGGQILGDHHVHGSQGGSWKARDRGRNSYTDS